MIYIDDILLFSRTLEDCLKAFGTGSSAVTICLTEFATGTVLFHVRACEVRGLSNHILRTPPHFPVPIAIAKSFSELL